MSTRLVPPRPKALASMSFRRRLHGLYLGYTVCFLLFLLGMGMLLNISQHESHEA